MQQLPVQRSAESPIVGVHSARLRVDALTQWIPGPTISTAEGTTVISGTQFANASIGLALMM